MSLKLATLLISVMSSQLLAYCIQFYSQTQSPEKIRGFVL